MATIGQVNSKAHYLGKQHDSAPVTHSDKKMSKRHLSHRAKVDKMPAKTPKDKLKKEVESTKYNAPHSIEHVQAMAPKGGKKQVKAIVKSIKKLQKAKMKELLKVRVKE